MSVDCNHTSVSFLANIPLIFPQPRHLFRYLLIMLINSPHFCHLFLYFFLQKLQFEQSLLFFFFQLFPMSTGKLPLIFSFLSTAMSANLTSSQSFNSDFELFYVGRFLLLSPIRAVIVDFFGGGLTFWLCSAFHKGVSF